MEHKKQEKLNFSFRVAWVSRRQLRITLDMGRWHVAHLTKESLAPPYILGWTLEILENDDYVPRQKGLSLRFDGSGDNESVLYLLNVGLPAKGEGSKTQCRLRLQTGENHFLDLQLVFQVYHLGAGAKWWLHNPFCSWVSQEAAERKQHFKTYDDFVEAFEDEK